MSLHRNDDWRSSTTHTCPPMPDDSEMVDDILHNGPIILTPEGAKRWREIMAEDAKPLPAPPLPIEDNP